MTKAVEKVNLQFQHGQYKRSIGYHQSPRTKQRVERVFWLGSDRAEAERRALLALALWGNCHGVDADGRRVWTQEELAFLESLFNAKTADPLEIAVASLGVAISERRAVLDVLKAQAKSTPQAAALVSQPLTLHQALTAWVSSVEQNPDHSEAWKRQIRQRTDILLRLKTAHGGPAFPDLSLQQVTYEVVMALVNAIKDRATNGFATFPSMPRAH